MIKAVIFDLDNTPLDFKNMKEYGVSAGYGDTTDIWNSGADWKVDDIYEVVHIIDELNSV